MLETATRLIEPTLTEDRDRVYRAEARSGTGQARLRVALRRYGAASFACIHERRMVDQNSASWNQISPWLKRLDALRLAA